MEFDDADAAMPCAYTMTNGNRDHSLRRLCAERRARLEANRLPPAVLVRALIRTRPHEMQGIAASLQWLHQGRF